VSLRLTRRRLLLGGAGLAVAGFAAQRLRPRPQPTPGELLGADHALGHRLRSGDFPPVSGSEATDVLVIGGGISGLAAGLALHDAGVTFTLTELEASVGGNSSAGANDVSAYPWGAHYVPLPTEESAEVRRLFERLGVITGYAPNGLPIYDEFTLCADPDERLLLHGEWQEGLLPRRGVGAAERAEQQRFFAQMAHYKTLRGSDGRRAFCIPLDASSQDAALLALDQISFAAWLAREAYASPALLWLLDYSCRDDYGAGLDAVSAWAGIHYFAARSGQAANADADTVLTWPQGNGWLVQKMATPLLPSIRTRALAVRVSDAPQPSADIYLPDENRSLRIQARAIILALPRFVAARIVDSAAYKIDASAFDYSPWLVANITLDRLPGGPGAALAWDNVVYGSAMLGYVVATHQNLDAQPRRTVLTWYWPLDHLPPAAARQQALARDAASWKVAIETELLRLHPELAGAIRRIDLRLWGHGMIRPRPGFIWGDARKQALAQRPPLFFAHSDLAGISIFEEAYTYGVNAARHAIEHLRAHA
jgi:hypothetical protein